MNKDLHTYIIMHNVFGDQDEYLEHFGAKGMHWGQRRWQNEDGSLTPAGREHYGYGDGRIKGTMTLAQIRAQNDQSRLANNKNLGTRIKAKANLAVSGAASIATLAGAVTMASNPVAAPILGAAGAAFGAKAAYHAIQVALNPKISYIPESEAIENQLKKLNREDQERRMSEIPDVDPTEFSKYYDYDAASGSYSKKLQPNAYSPTNNSENFNDVYTDEKTFNSVSNMEGVDEVLSNKKVIAAANKLSVENADCLEYESKNVGKTAKKYLEGAENADWEHESVRKKYLSVYGDEDNARSAHKNDIMNGDFDMAEVGPRTYYLMSEKGMSYEEADKAENNFVNNWSKLNSSIKSACDKTYSDTGVPKVSLNYTNGEKSGSTSMNLSQYLSANTSKVAKIANEKTLASQASKIESLSNSGYSVPEIAKKLNIPEGSVSSVLYA